MPVMFMAKNKTVTALQQSGLKWNAKTGRTVEEMGKGIVQNTCVRPSK